MEKTLYYIQTSGYVCNSPLFWGLNSCGYTTDLDKAQKYTEEEAKRICENRTCDVAWPVDYIDRKVIRMVDMQYLDNKERRWADVPKYPNYFDCDAP